MTQDGPSVPPPSQTAAWGIFRGTTPVVVSDNVVSLDYKQAWTLLDYPVEQGGFDTYNQVATPYEPRIRFSTGGSRADRQAFLGSIEAIAGDLNLYNVATPEKTYLNANVMRYDYRRENQSVGLLAVDVYLREVRQTGETAFTNSKAPSGASKVNDGVVQPVPATPAQVSMAGASQDLQAGFGILNGPTGS